MTLSGRADCANALSLGMKGARSRMLTDIGLALDWPDHWPEIVVHFSGSYKVYWHPVASFWPALRSCRPAPRRIHTGFDRNADRDRPAGHRGVPPGSSGY